MRGGILIIGSLLWDQRRERDEWRQARLRIDEAVYVKVPIGYGRRSESRGNTFTMTFVLDGPLGQGVLVPCRATIADVAALVAEAEALWKAEQLGASAGSIGASWGCVGVLFRAQPVPEDWLRAWADHFRATASPVSPVGEDGVLRISWPMTVADGTAADVDVILATATKAESTHPVAGDVADAWLGQDRGHERYFFENVRHGIRSPEDGLVWKRIEEGRPRWLRGGAYAEAVAVLRRQAAPPKHSCCGEVRRQGEEERHSQE